MTLSNVLTCVTVLISRSLCTPSIESFIAESRSLIYSDRGVCFTKSNQLFRRKLNSNKDFSTPLSVCVLFMYI